MKTPRELAARFPYQVEGENFGLCVTKGWFPLFVQLCTEIDKLLGDNKQHFRWLHIKEKFGSCRLQWVAEKATDAETVELIRAISELVRKAEKQTGHTCAVCGTPDALDRLDDYVITLCPAHAQARRANPASDLGMSFPFEDDFPQPMQSLKNLIEDGRA